MKLEPLPPIPSPTSQHWRQFRIHVLPPASFVVVLVLTVWLWSVNMVNPLLFGTAEGRQADILSPEAGRLVKLLVEPYQEVRAGDIIAVVDAVKPEVLTNTIAMIRAEMEAIRADAGFDTGDKVRYAQFQLDWMQHRTELASMKVRLSWAMAEFARIEQLMKQNISFQQEYDTAKRDLEDAKEQLAEKEVLVEKSGQVLKSLNPDTFNPDTPAVRAAIAVAQQQLKLAEAELQPTYLTAPISGRVSKLTKFAGAIVASAEVIATISDPNVDRIIGYVSQPIRLEPRVGMAVEIRTRGAQRMTGRAQITHVGPRIELFTAPLRIRGMGAAQERGLPFVVSLPPDLKLLPGELVDVTILPKPRS